MLPTDIAGSNPMRDVAVGKAGNMVTITTDGTIYELDPEGYTLFYFGGREDGTNRAGLFVQPSAIEIDGDGQLLVADREKEPLKYLVQLVLRKSCMKELVYSRKDITSKVKRSGRMCCN